MLRVGDLQRSIDFYTQVLGMKLLRTTERPEQKYYAGVRRLRHATPSMPRSSSPTTTASTATSWAAAYGHIAIGVPDVAYLRLAQQDRAPAAASHARAGPVKGGTTVIAFVTDPDGYKIELIQRQSRLESALAQRDRLARERVMRAQSPCVHRIGRRQPRAAAARDVGQRQELGALPA